MKIIFLNLVLGLFLSNSLFASDPGQDKNILFSTAQTAKQGDFIINDYEVVFPGISYGLSDHIQLSVNSLLPITNEMPLVLMSSVKFKLVDADRFAVSLQPNFWYIRATHTTYDFSPGTFAPTTKKTSSGYTLIGTQLLLDYSLADSQDLVLHGTLSVQFPEGASQLLIAGGGLSARVSSGVKLLSEVLLPLTNNREVQMLLNYGIRFFGEKVAVDLSFLKPLGGIDQVKGGYSVSNSFALGFPWISFSAKI